MNSSPAPNLNCHVTVVRTDADAECKFQHCNEIQTKHKTRLTKKPGLE